MADPLRNHRDIVALAAARVDRRYKAAAIRLRAHGTIPGGYVRDRAIDEEVELDLLLDPAEPDTDALSRILAARVGVVVGATAPRFYRDEILRAWVLDGDDCFHEFRDLFVLTSPTDALFAALNATQPEPHHGR